MGVEDPLSAATELRVNTAADVSRLFSLSSFHSASMIRGLWNFFGEGKEFEGRKWLYDDWGALGGDVGLKVSWKEVLRAVFFRGHYN